MGNTVPKKPKKPKLKTASENEKRTTFMKEFVKRFPNKIFTGNYMLSEEFFGGKKYTWMLKDQNGETAFPVLLLFQGSSYALKSADFNCLSFENDKKQRIAIEFKFSEYDELQYTALTWPQRRSSFIKTEFFTDLALKGVVEAKSFTPF